MDNLRAMREARYAEAQKRAGSAPARPKAPVAPTAAPTAAPTVAASPTRATPATDAASPAEGFCGHRNMSGRTCTREQGHPQKSHRYS